MRPLDGVTEMLDRMGALGMISVFDVEEIGEEALQAELEMSPELAAQVVDAAALKAKDVAEQQEREREEQEALRANDEEATAGLLMEPGGGESDPDVESRASDILGGGPVAPVVEEQPASDDVSQTMESNPEVNETSAPEGALEGAEEPTKQVDG